MSEILPSLTGETTTETETVDPFHTAEVVYLGRRKNGKRVCEAFVTLAFYNAMEENLQALHAGQSLFDPPKRNSYRQPAIVGGVYDMECVVENFELKRARTGGWKFKYRVFDNSLVAAWQQEDRTATLLVEEQKHLQKLKEDDLLEQNMQFLKDVYRKLPVTQRIAFEFAVLRRLRMGA